MRNFNAYKLYVGARAAVSLPSLMSLDNLAVYDANTSAYLASIEAVVGIAP